MKFVGNYCTDDDVDDDQDDEDDDDDAGMRIEGKYKNNVLVASSSGSRSSSKIFTLRSGKIRDRVDAAIRGAQKAADVALQKAEIANNRYRSAVYLHYIHTCR